MATAFFEIDPRYVITDAKDKQNEANYPQIIDSLGKVQGLMDQGLSGKEIQAQNPGQSTDGVAETYRQFYNSAPEKKIRLIYIKVLTVIFIVIMAIIAVMQPEKKIYLFLLRLLVTVSNKWQRYAQNVIVVEI